MVTPAALDAHFAAWLAAHERTAPTDSELAEFVAALPQPAQRRAARVYARGFLRGCAYCGALSATERERGLAAIEADLAATLALVRALRLVPPPESTL